MTFTRPANHRQLTFEEIAKSAKITVNEVQLLDPGGVGAPTSTAWGDSRRPLSAQVELLVMKALSVGLVKGSIDEVDKRVHMTWVQPRVLDLQQVTHRSPPGRGVGTVSAVLVSLGWKPGRKKAVPTGFRECITAVGREGFSGSLI